jgi:hypothetical protein
MRHHALAVAAGGAAVALLLGTACGGQAARDATAPTCSGLGPRLDRVAPLYLVAQSVPTAQQVPCIHSYPAGWTLKGVEVRNGRTSFSLDAHGDGPNGVKVILQKDCVLTDAIETPTDEPGTVRYDRIPATASGSRIVRSYVFPGGCVNYEFSVGPRTRSLEDEASLALGFVPRSEIDARVRTETRRAPR